ncbi:MAG: response regulator [Elusimicrobiota bacterium]
MSAPCDVLVVDDEPVVAQAVSKILGAEGMTVDVADQGKAALEKLAKRSYRLIICDIMMADVDGFQFLAELARRRLATPVVMATGYATVENAVRSLTCGAADFIAKPFTAEEILAVARRALRCGELQRDAARAGRRDSLAFVPCPPKYYRLGCVSWVKAEDAGTVLVGLNDMFLKALERIESIELAPVHDEVVQGVSCASIASPGGTSGVMCPVTGRIVEVNDAAKRDPMAVEKDPYFEGWLYRVVPTDLQSDLQRLIPCSSDRM